MNRKMSYTDLMLQYKEMIEMFDAIHFNSSVSSSVYKSHVAISDSEVIPIIHSNILDNRQKREFRESCLNLIFIGSKNTYKGFPLLEKVLCRLTNKGLKNYHLEVWGSSNKSTNTNIKFRGNFTASELSKIFIEDALLIVPSIWYETFGFTVLEAISHGVPVLVSSTVGSKDIVATYDEWFIYKDQTDLEQKLITLLKDKTKLKEFNNKIINSDWKHSMEEHAKEIIKLYNK